MQRTPIPVSIPAYPKLWLKLEDIHEPHQDPNQEKKASANPDPNQGQKASTNPDPDQDQKASTNPDPNQDQKAPPR